MKSDGELKKENFERIKTLIRETIEGDAPHENILPPLLHKQVDHTVDKRTSRSGGVLLLSKVRKIFKP